MKYDISAMGNALVDTQFKVDHSFLNKFNLIADQMIIATKEQQDAMLYELMNMGSESVSDCGGSATNSLVAASYFGSNCHHICRISDDEDGKKYLESLTNAKIKHIGFTKTESDLSTGKCLILVTPDAARTMISVLGVSASLCEEDIDIGVIKNSELFYIEGYMVTTDDNFAAVSKVLSNLENSNTLKALSLSDAGLVKIFMKRFKEIELSDLDIVFGNKDEALAFSESDNFDEACNYFAKQSYMTIITLGGDGAICIKNNKIIRSEAINISPVDTNGAGDMFAGAFMHAYLKKYELKKCLDFANYAASKIVETFGPRLLKENYEELKKYLKKN